MIPVKNQKLTNKFHQGPRGHFKYDLLSQTGGEKLAAKYITLTNSNKKISSLSRLFRRPLHSKGRLYISRCVCSVCAVTFREVW